MRTTAKDLNISFEFIILWEILLYYYIMGNEGHPEEPRPVGDEPHGP